MNNKYGKRKVLGPKVVNVGVAFYEKAEEKLLTRLVAATGPIFDTLPGFH